MPARSQIPRLLSKRRFRELTSYEWSTVEELAERAGGLYSPFDIAVAGRSKPRHIDNPVPRLKTFQRRLAKGVLSRVTLPPNMYGALKGSSIQVHARLHVGKSCTVTLDLRECFPSTDNLAVAGVFEGVFGCPPWMAYTLTKLCTVRHRLPQGAPTSPEAWAGTWTAAEASWRWPSMLAWVAKTGDPTGDTATPR